MKARYRILDHLERLAPAPGDKKRALAEARRIAAFLRETYGAETFGVGSLFLEGRPFTEMSDIDLVVKGIPGDKYFSILAEVEKLTTFSFDLVPYEDANGFLRRLADEEGVKL